MLGDSKQQLEKVQGAGGRVFGRLASEAMSAQERHDPHIYNDLDFYQLMLKDFLASNDSATA
jgi:hypothetical protein